MCCAFGMKNPLFCALQSWRRALEQVETPSACPRFLLPAWELQSVGTFPKFSLNACITEEAATNHLVCPSHTTRVKAKIIMENGQWGPALNALMVHIELTADEQQIVLALDSTGDLTDRSVIFPDFFSPNPAELWQIGLARRKRLFTGFLFLDLLQAGGNGKIYYWPGETYNTFERNWPAPGTPEPLVGRKEWERNVTPVFHYDSDHFDNQPETAPWVYAANQQPEDALVRGFLPFMYSAYTDMLELKKASDVLVDSLGPDPYYLTPGLESHVYFGSTRQLILVAKDDCHGHFLWTQEKMIPRGLNSHNNHHYRIMEVEYVTAALAHLEATTRNYEEFQANYPSTLHFKGELGRQLAGVAQVLHHWMSEWSPMNHDAAA